MVPRAKILNIIPQQKINQIDPSNPLYIITEKFVHADNEFGVIVLDHV
jgi:hypothetical protein